MTLTTEEAAALFRYTLPSKLSLAAHTSALVPLEGFVAAAKRELGKL